MNTPNPYASSAPAQQPTYSSQGGALTSQALEPLRRTSKWVRLIGVMTILFSLFLAAIGVMMAIGFASVLNQFPEMQGMGGAPALFLGGFFIVFGLFYFYPGYKLWRYGSKCTQVVAAPSEQGLTDALKQQHHFWRFVGVLTVISIVFFLLNLIGTAVMWSPQSIPVGP